MMIHNENSRVKIPALLHFTRLGYEYLSLKNANSAHDERTNIFLTVFQKSINYINHTSLSEENVAQIIQELADLLSYDDLGRAFYNALLSGLNGLKLIDWETFSLNSFHVVTELTYQNGQDEFRPDITVLINGMPLAFVEVKIPNNRDGMLAERERINTRFQNRKFLRFINIMQLLVFSNNMPYSETEIDPIEGAYYASSDYKELFFNRFREEKPEDLSHLEVLNPATEEFILKDTNLVAIKGTQEYITNCSHLTSTNSMITSLFSRDRIKFLLRYGIAYVEKEDKKTGIKTLHKHIMRYQQVFAAIAIADTLRSGTKNGIIWHTQGSGKTALAYYNVRFLTDFFQKQGRVAKFYFIVDRLSLLKQASDEFVARGLLVEKVNKKEEFISNIGSTGEKNNTGKPTITVVNIQKFSDKSISRPSDYNVNVQRIYFMDEAHRSYDPKGSFLSNLVASDRDAVMIALTGTPLIGNDRKTKDVFGGYIHTYYYNRSIADGYTLKLIREGIKTEYRRKLQSVLDHIETEKGSLSRRDLYAHPKYAAALTEYIVKDFLQSRIAMGDDTIGGMIVCDSSMQARNIFGTLRYHPEVSSALILHDEDDKETRDNEQDDFKDGKIDLLVVYNMLLTGFDAPRLKRLYMCRIIHEQNLLQALTRVNRPYRKFRYGYVVDFADIRAEFDKTNAAYFKELQEELGDEFQRYRDIFKEQSEIEHDLQLIQERLFLYDTDNAEVFSQQVTAIDDKQELIELRNALEAYRELTNLAVLFGYDKLAIQFPADKVKALYNEVNRRIQIINMKESLQKGQDTGAILNLAMEEIEFTFRKISKEELVIADKFEEVLRRTREAISQSLDPKDPEYVSLLEELQRIFKSKNIEELTAGEMTRHIDQLEHIRKRAEQQNLRDQMLCAKYGGDAKYMRTHKRIKENPPPIAGDVVLQKILLSVKGKADDMVLRNQSILENEAYFTRSFQPFILDACRENNVQATRNQIMLIRDCLSSEYRAERKGA